MDDDEPLYRELDGAQEGRNPVFGEWSQTFAFPAIPHTASSSKRQAFYKAIREQLTNQFLYTHFVQIEITLYFDWQRLEETDQIADLDNYAKAILDALKGPQGILLDDGLVQSLCISWMDSYRREKERFKVRIKGSPDDFMMKPVTFYEMPDRLWHPFSRNVWGPTQTEVLTDRDLYAGLVMVETMADVRRKVRHGVGQRMGDRLKGRHASTPFFTSSKGLHRSKVDESFPVVPMAKWRAELVAWKRSNRLHWAPIGAVLRSYKWTWHRTARAFGAQAHKRKKRR